MHVIHSRASFSLIKIQTLIGPLKHVRKSVYVGYLPGKKEKRLLGFHPSRRCHLPRLRCLRLEIDGSPPPQLATSVAGGDGDLGPALGP
jgi:hypothetical protein